MFLEAGCYYIGDLHKSQRLLRGATWQMSETQRKSSTGVHNLLEPEAEEVLDNQSDFKNQEDPRFGFESEYGLLNGDRPAKHDEREEAITKMGFADTELGESMVETRTDPQTIEDLQQVEVAIADRENQLLEQLAEHDLELVRYGTVPLVDIQDIRLSQPEGDADRYWELVNAFNEIRREHKGELPDFGSVEQIDPNTAATPGMTCSTQMNWQGKSLEDTISKANYAQQIAPYAIAVSGASRIISEKDTGHQDTRMPLWEMNYNTEENPGKVGALDGFYNSVEHWLESLDIFADSQFDHPDDYSEDEKSPLETAIKEDWNDVKIKLVEDQERNREYPVVEVRPYSMQPTPAEEAAVHGFTIGRVAYAQENEEALMDYEMVLENRDKAMEKGLDADEMFYLENGEIKTGPTPKVIRGEIEKAREGLELMNIDDPGYLDIMEMRTYQGSPSDKSAELFNELNEEMDREQAIREALPIYDQPFWNSENLRKTHYETL